MPQFQYGSCLLTVGSRFFRWDASYLPQYLQAPPPAHRHTPSMIQSSSACGDKHYSFLLHRHLPTSVLQQCQFCPAEPIYSNYLSFPPAACFPTGRTALLLNSAQSTWCACCSTHRCFSLTRESCKFHGLPSHKMKYILLMKLFFS